MVTAFSSFSSGNGNAVEDPRELTPDPREDETAKPRDRVEDDPCDRVEDACTGNGNAVENPLEAADPLEVTSEANDLLDAALAGGVGGQLFTVSRSRTSIGSNPQGMGEGEGDGEWRRCCMALTRWVRGRTVPHPRGLPCGLAYGLVYGLACRLLCGLWYGLLRGLAYGLLCGLACRLLCGLEYGLGTLRRRDWCGTLRCVPAA